MSLFRCFALRASVVHYYVQKLIHSKSGRSQCRARYCGGTAGQDVANCAMRAGCGPSYCRAVRCSSGCGSGGSTIFAAGRVAG